METITAIRSSQVQASPRTRWTFVEIATSAGRIGLGEASLHYGEEEILAHVSRLADALQGLAATVRSMPGLMAETASLPEVAATCAIDQALFDLEAQCSGCPIAALLDAVPRTEIAMYANINRRTVDRTPAGFAMSAAAAVHAGMKAIKIAPFDRVRPHMSRVEAAPRLAVAFERIAAVREAIGPDCLLMVDCHWRLNAGMVDDVVREAAKNTLFWIETPFAEEPEWFDAIRALRGRANDVGVRIAGAELKVNLSGFAPIIDAGLYDVLMPDMTFVGGYAAFMQVAEAAASARIHVSPHSPTGPVCHAHSVQVSSVVPQFLHMEMQFDESPLFAQIVAGALPLPRNGRIQVPRDAGLGLRLLPVGDWGGVPPSVPSGVP